MKVLCTVVAIVALTLSQPAFAKQKALTDAQLDSITAGSEGHQSSDNDGSGGAIVANNSSASLSTTGAVELSADAQAGARGLNIVNGSESTVANGVNVWDGRVTDDAQFSDGANFSVEQFNKISQEQRRVATVSEYVRPEANVIKSGSQSASAAGTASASSATQNISIETSESARELNTTSEVNTETVILGQVIQGGRGAAGSGDLDIHFDAGEVSFIATADVGPLTGELSLTIELPSLDISFDGTLCAVQMGSCSAEGMLEESASSLSDHSVLTESSSSDSFENASTSDFAWDVRGRVSLTDSQAEFIVVDDSTLDVASSNTIALSDAAQSDLRGLNVVNAAGSAVANAVNIARTSSANALVGTGRLLTLNQKNVIVHSR